MTTISSCKTTKRLFGVPPILNPFHKSATGTIHLRENLYHEEWNPLRDHSTVNVRHYYHRRRSFKGKVEEDVTESDCDLQRKEKRLRNFGIEKKSKERVQKLKVLQSCLLKE